VGSPEEVVKAGDEIQASVLRVDVGERKLALSSKQAGRPQPEGREGGAESAARGDHPPGRELRGGTGAGTGQLFSLPAGRPGAEGESEAADVRS